jgi:hypothetical protein
VRSASAGTERIFTKRRKKNKIVMVVVMEGEEVEFVEGGPEIPSSVEGQGIVKRLWRRG